MGRFTFDQTRDLLDGFSRDPSGFDPLTDTGRAIAVGLTFACELYRDAGNALFTENGLPSPTADILDRFCPLVDAPLPPKEPVPPGGRCAFPYNVTVDAQNADLNQAFVETYTGFGPIGGIASRSDSNGANTIGIQFSPPPGDTFDAFTGVVSWFNGDDTGKSWKVRIISIVPVGGGPDDCGSLLPEPTPRPLPPGATRDPNFSPTFAPQFNFDVGINPVFAPIGIKITPSLNIDVGPFNINFDLGGIDVNVDIGGGGSPPSPPSPPSLPPANPTPPTGPGGPGTPPGGGGGGGTVICPPCPPVDLDEVLELLRDIKECACPPEVDIRSVSGGGDSFDLFVNGDIELIGLVVELDQPVTQATRIQSGNSQSPRVVFAGWVAWGALEGLGERIPLSYENSFFYPPVPGLRRAAGAFTQGNTGRGMLIYREKRE